MGIPEDAKSTADEAVKRVERAVDDTVHRVGEKVDEVKAAAAVKKAEAEQASLKASHAAKDAIRDS